MSETGFVIPTAPQFAFERAALSHGWRMLAPFSWDQERGTLLYVFESAAGAVLRLRLRAVDGGIEVSSPDRPAPAPVLAAEIQRAVKTMLNVEWDLSGFYAAMGAHEGYEWLEAERRGRILIAPSLWEDLAKTLLTTNCNWAQTVNMCRQLVKLGATHPTIEDCYAFPSAERIAALDFDDFAARVRAGYRSAYLYELARKVAAGDAKLDVWLTFDEDAFYRAVKSLKGFGDYAAGTMARMYGHFDKIAIDSAAHAMFAERHNGGVKGSEADIKARYEPFGRWRGLILWMDIMRHFES